MSRNVIIRSRALCKMILHASRYPHLAINGVVLAKTKNAQEEIVIVDAVPLFHLQLGLAPLLEVALIQIEQRFKTEGLVIAGYYQANEHIRNNVPDFVALKIAEKIAENNNNDVSLIMLDNRKIGLLDVDLPLVVSQVGPDGKWQHKDPGSVHAEDGSMDILSQLLYCKVQQEIYDFDVHLDDLTCDWANPHINSMLRTFSLGSNSDVEESSEEQ